MTIATILIQARMLMAFVVFLALKYRQANKNGKSLIVQKFSCGD